MTDIYKSSFLSPIDERSFKYLASGYMVVDAAGVIQYIGQEDPGQRFKDAEFFDYSDFLICPGFVDIHNHIPQYAFAGIGDEELLQWLDTYAFPREKEFLDLNVAKKSTRIFFRDQLRNGTTTTLSFVTIHDEATDIAFEEAKKTSIRAVIGSVMMDQNCPPYLLETPDEILNESRRLIEKWDGYEDRLYYCLTPRFAISCSFDLLCKVGELAREKNVYVQSHLSENKNEILYVKELFPRSTNYTNVYEDAGLLGSKTIMAHCVHLTDEEIRRLKKTKTKIAHCPTSNRFLKSGIMPYRSFRTLGLQIGLGTDVAGGYSLSLFHEMKEMIENSKYRSLFFDDGSPVTLAEAFYTATLGGAECLSMEERIGSLEKNKLADFLVLDHFKTDPHKKDSNYLNPDEILSKLIYRGSSDIVRHVYVQGKKVF
mgnify:CR=1 FL=1